MIYSPLEQFTVVPLLGFSTLLNSSWSLTNVGIYTFILVLLVLLIHSTISGTLTGSKWSLPVETSYDSVSVTVKEQSGNTIYLPLIYSVFCLLLVGNLLGNVPYGYAVTSSAAVALGLSVTVFVSVTVLSVWIHGIHFFAFFVPAGTPLALVPILVLIEFISYLSRAVSLGLRLASNIVSGHTLLHILSSFLLGLFKKSAIVAMITLVPFAIFLSLIGLEFAVSFIQSYVFVILMSSYIRDARELH